MIKHKDLFYKIRFCRACSLHKYRLNLVIGRGSIPARILFIGEGPGKTEDLLAEAFVGPSGNLLNMTLQDASLLAGVKIPSYYITNAVLCRPWISDSNDRDYGNNREPKKKEVLSCMSNIMQIYKIVKPEYIIFIGRVSEGYYKKEFPDSIRITHPAFHLRYGGKASPTYLQDVRVLSELFKGMKK